MTFPSKYDKQAIAFLSQTKSTVSRHFSHTGKYFPGDKEPRDIYNVTIISPRHAFTFTFGDSLARTQERKFGEKIIPPPSAYTILASLTKYPVESLDEFASEYGYSDGKMKISEVIKLHEAVKKEWENVSQLWTEEELEMLREIA